MNSSDITYLWLQYLDNNPDNNPISDNFERKRNKPGHKTGNPPQIQKNSTENIFVTVRQFVTDQGTDPMKNKDESCRC